MGFSGGTDKHRTTGVEVGGGGLREVRRALPFSRRAAR